MLPIKSTRSQTTIIILFLFISFGGADDDIYQFTVKDAVGGDVSLQHFKGKTLLIVNVASECGYTDSHYRDLVSLQSKYQADNFQVLAFPCNDFGQQEPNEPSEIITFAQTNYGLNFPIYAKVHIPLTSPNVTPLFKFLQEKTTQTINWNFHKFLVSSEGVIVGEWAARVGVYELEEKIRQNLLPTQKGGQHRGSRSEF